MISMQNAFEENPEKCDYIDNDCDEEVDNLAEDALIWYLDEDQDQYGNQNFFIQACENPGGFTKVTTDADGNELFDCDDQNRLVFPGAAEVCDTVDNDCNRLIDEDDPNLFGNATWYRDADGDGYGNPELFIDSCEPQPGYVQGEEELPVEQQDCNDALAIVNPAQAELCDEIDNDCDGQIDGEDQMSCPIECGGRMQMEMVLVIHWAKHCSLAILLTVLQEHKQIVMTAMPKSILV